MKIIIILFPAHVMPPLPGPLPSRQDPHSAICVQDLHPVDAAGFVIRVQFLQIFSGTL